MTGNYTDYLGIIIINKSLQRTGHFSVQVTLLSKCVLYLPI